MVHCVLQLASGRGTIRGGTDGVAEVDGREHGTLVINLCFSARTFSILDWIDCLMPLMSQSRGCPWR